MYGSDEDDMEDSLTYVGDGLDNIYKEEWYIKKNWTSSLYKIINVFQQVKRGIQIKIKVHFQVKERHRNNIRLNYKYK